jgi:hypothetical protein
MSPDTIQRIHDLLGRLPTDGLSAAKQLFWTELNYDRAAPTLSQRDWPDRARCAERTTGPPGPPRLRIRPIRHHLRPVGDMAAWTLSLTAPVTPGFSPRRLHSGAKAPTRHGAAGP